MLRAESLRDSQYAAFTCVSATEDEDILRVVKRSVWNLGIRVTDVRNDQCSAVVALSIQRLEEEKEEENGVQKAYL